MEFTKQDMKMLKGIAIIFMLSLHLFCRKIINGLYITSPEIHGVPFVYYLALFADACVPIYCFASGYGLFVTYAKQGPNIKKNLMRLLKLLINYWIILLLFVAVGFVAGVSAYPGSVSKFFLNFFVLSSSYNGAWWFLQTYIILVFMSPWLFKIVKKYNSTLILLLSGFIYLIAYIQRFKFVIDFGDNSAINMLVNAIVLVGTSQLPFIAGAIFAKEKIYTKVYNQFGAIPFKNTLCLIGIALLVVIHSLYQSLIIAPLTATSFICLFTLIDKKPVVQKFFDFFGGHSTNL